MSGVFPFPHSLLSRVLCPELTVRHFVGGSPTTREEHGPRLEHGDLKLEQGGWSREPSAEWGRGYCAPSLTRLRIQSRDKGRRWSPARRPPSCLGKPAGGRAGRWTAGSTGFVCLSPGGGRPLRGGGGGSGCSSCGDGGRYDSWDDGDCCGFGGGSSGSNISTAHSARRTHCSWGQCGRS